MWDSPTFGVQLKKWKLLMEDWGGEQKHYIVEMAVGQMCIDR